MINTGDGDEGGRALHRRGCVSGIRARDQTVDILFKYRQRINKTSVLKGQRSKGHNPN